jgi:hypothetical protein
MRFFLFLLIFTLSGCSADTVQRLTYESVQNLRQQQCQKNLSATNCNTRQSYDSYQQNLQELK